MYSNYGTTNQDSFQSASARPTSPEHSTLPSETIRVPKQEEDVLCSEGPVNQQANPAHDMVSSL